MSFSLIFSIKIEHLLRLFSIIFGLHAPHSLPTRGTPVDDPQPSIVIFVLFFHTLILLKNFRLFLVVRLITSAIGSCLTSDILSTIFVIYDGSFLFPR